MAAATTAGVAHPGSFWCCSTAEQAAHPRPAPLGHVLMVASFEGRRCCLPCVPVPKPTPGC